MGASTAWAPAASPFPPRAVPTAAEGPPAAGRGAYPWRHVHAARLPDGTLVSIRPIHADDLDRLARFAASLSLRTRTQRLMSARKLLPGELRRMTDIDYRRELALVALPVAADPDAVAEPDFLAVARTVVEDPEPADGRRRAEFAIVVADAWQGRGLGTLLLRRLVTAARADGVGVLVGSTLSDNRALLALARRLGFGAWREPGDAAVTQLRLVLRPSPSAGGRVADLLHEELRGLV